MILFFHFICLLARYFIVNISKSISLSKLFSEDDTDYDSLKSQSSDFLQAQKKGYAKEPTYEDGSLKFFPPVYIQRYETVALVIHEFAKKGNIKKIVDFGCSEMGFFRFLKNMEGVEEILEIDVDDQILERNSFKAAPLTVDYLINKTNKPLDVYILAGNIAEYDDCLQNTDVVVAIEVIEHLTGDVLKKMPYNIFHLIKPKLAVFTTPNADFNSLFPNFGDVRHADHKFEWTRKEFYNWTQKVIHKYPDYACRFFGIGAGPAGTENLGCCSQMAVFQRLENAVDSVPKEELADTKNYKLIKHFKYPVYEDCRTPEEKVIHEILHQVSHINSLPDYYNYEESENEIPLSLLKDYVADVCMDENELRDILLKNGMKLRQHNDSWFLICTESDFNSSENSSAEDDWSNEELFSSSDHKQDLTIEENWDWKEEPTSLEDIANFQSARSLGQFKSETENKVVKKATKTKSYIPVKEETKSAPHCCDKSLESVKVPSKDPKSEELKKNISVKCKIPRRKSGKDIEKEKLTKKTTLICKYPRISKSCSLDSCLENINCKPSESDSFYLNLIPGGSVPFRGASSLSSKKGRCNDSGSSLFSSSLDRAGDSGYPFSFSPPDADLTPEQVDELLTEMSRSSSASSEVDAGEAVFRRAPADLFLEEVVVENGDLANNNRDGEGNNVEGLRGQRLVNEMAVERDPNDNMFFPEIQEFPLWLLNLGELALRPVFVVPRDLFAHDEGVGVGDDSSSDFNQSLDLDDEFYFEEEEMS